MSDPARTFLARIQPRTMAVILSGALVALHLILLGGALLRWGSALRIEVQVENINDNVESVDETELAELRQLETTLEAARAEVRQLQERLPDPTAPFPLYVQAYVISQDVGPTLLNIERSGTEVRQTPAGEIETHAYRVALEADLQTCLNYLTDLEEVGGAELAVENLRVEPATSTCAFDAVTVALTDAQ